MCTAAAEVMSARKGGHNRTPALQTLVQETCWHQCVLCGTHLPALGSALPRRLQQVLEGFSPQDKWQAWRKCFIPSPRQQGAGMRQMSSFGNSIANGRGKYVGNHNSCKGTKGPSPGSTARLRDPHMPGPHGPCPAASKLMVPSKHPPQHTAPIGCFPTGAQHSSDQSPMQWAAPPGWLQLARHACIHPPLWNAKHTALWRLEPGHRETTLGYRKSLAHQAPPTIQSFIVTFGKSHGEHGCP